MQYKINKNLSKKELINQYNKWVGTANKSLYRLELLENEVYFENVTRYAYAKAIKNIQRKNPEKNRFQKINDSMSKNEIQGQINNILEFLNSPTRTKSGIKRVYQKRAETINARYGTNFDWQTLADYYRDAKNQKISTKLGSTTSLVMLGEAQKKDVEELENIYRSLNKNRKLKKYDTKDELIQNIFLHPNATMRNLDIMF